MVLNIKDPDTDRLARELAALTGESITTAARRALEERLERVQSRAHAAATSDDLMAVIIRGRARAMLDPRTAEAVIGYDEDGLPA